MNLFFHSFFFSRSFTQTDKNNVMLNMQTLAGLLLLVKRQKTWSILTWLIVLARRLVRCDLAAAWEAKWRWQSFRQVAGDVFRPGQGKQGRPGWRINHQHPAWQHNTHPGKYNITVFLMPLLTSACFSWTYNLSFCSPDVIRHYNLWFSVFISWKEDSAKYYTWRSFGPGDPRTQELWVDMTDLRRADVRVHGILSNSYKQASVSQGIKRAL